MSTLNPPLSNVAAWLVGIVLTTALAATVVMTADVLMLVFLGLLFGIFLCQCSRRIEQQVPWTYGISLAIVTVLVLGSTAATLYGLAMNLDTQLDNASSQLDSSVEKVEKWLESKPTVFDAVKRVPFSDQFFQQHSEREKSRSGEGASAVKSNAVKANAVKANGDKASADRNNANGENENENANPADGRVEQDLSGKIDESQSDPLRIKKTTGDAIRTASGRVIQTLRKMVETTFGLLANIGIIFFVGIFVAADPALYRDGFAKLFRVDRRNRISEVMNLMGDSMFRWIIGRFISMLLTGTGTAIALALLGVPMPVTIGIATGLLTFIPNIGGIIALILAALMALTQGPTTVGWVVLAYGGIQLVESNVITPMIQQYQTSIPPALLISFQLIFGVLNGFLGIMIATPLLAAIFPLVKEMWIKDVLGDKD